MRLPYLFKVAEGISIQSPTKTLIILFTLNRSATCKAIRNIKTQHNDKATLFL